MFYELLKSYCAFSVGTIIKIPYLHYLLILLEYFPVFTCSINSAIRVLFDIYPQFSFQRSILSFTATNPLNLFRNSIFSQAGSRFYPTELLAIIAGCLILRLFLVILISRKETRRNWLNFCLSVFTNFFDLFFFRYCSLFAIDLQVNIFLKLSSSGGVFSLLSIVAMIILVAYFRSLYTCVFNCVIWIVLKQNKVSTQISNSNLDNNVIQGDYPFDRIFSAKYDMYLSILKFLLCMELNMFEAADVITRKVLLQGLFLIIFQLYFFFLLLYMLLSSNGLMAFSFNRGYNLFRMVLLVFHNISIICVLIFFTETTSMNIYAPMLVFALLFAVFIVYFLWYRHIKEKFYSPVITVPQLMYLIGQDITSNEDNLQIKIYLNLLQRKHESQCLMKTTCRLCNSDVNILSFISVFRFLFKQVQVRSKDEKLYYDIIKLVYYYYTKKSFKLFSHYMSCVHKYKKTHASLLYNMSHVVHLFTSEGNGKSESGYITKVFHLYEICAELESLIGYCYWFLNLGKNMHKPEQILSICSRLRNVKDSFTMVYHTIDFKDDGTMLYETVDQRNSKESIKYLLLVERFVLEGLMNKPLENTMMNDLELMEEYLGNHYANDKHMLIEAKLMNDRNHPTFTILHCEGELSKFKGKLVEEIIHEDFRKEGLSQFVKKLRKHKCEINVEKKKKKDRQLTSTFEFIITVDTYSEVFQYVFFPNVTFINNSVILQGEYMLGYKNILITEKCSDHCMTLHSFSKKFGKFLMINPRWLDRLQKNRKIQRVDCIFTEIKADESGSGNFECFLDYRYYYQWYYEFINSLVEESDFQFADQEEANKTFQILKERDNTRYKINFIRAFEFSCENRVFSVYSMREINQRSYNSVINSTMKTMEERLILTLEGNENNNILENVYDGYGYNSTGTKLRESTSSVTSVERMSFEKWINKNSNKVFSDESTKQIESVERSFSIFTYTVIIVNVLIVAMSVTFMVMQSYNSQRFDEMYNLFIEYKVMRNTVTDSYLSILSNTCIGELNTTNGVNYYEEYSHNLSRIAQSQDFRLYLLNELGYKVMLLEQRFQNFQNHLYDFNNIDLLSLMKLKMNYFSIIQNSNQGFAALTSEITLEEGIKRYINSISVMINSKPTFDQSPVYLFSFFHDSLDMSTVYGQHINPAQRENYHVIANYIHYVKTFTKCEAEFELQFEYSKKYNMGVLVSFMVFIEALNALLFILVLWNIFFAKHLIKRHVTEMLGPLNDPEFKKFHCAKLSNLRSLSLLYEENPNQLIQKITSGKKKAFSKATKKSSKTHLKPAEANVGESIIEKEKINENRKENNSLKDKRNDDYGFVINSYLYLAYLLFAIYFVYALAFTVLLLSTSSEVDDTIDYVWTNVRLENVVYNNINMIQVISLANITEDELVAELEVAPVSTGYMNYRLQLVLEYWNEIEHAHKMDSDLFQDPTQVINYHCNTMFRQINDSMTYYTGSVFKEDYFLMLEKLCTVFNFTSTSNFGFLIHEISYQTFRILSKVNLTTYESRAELNRFDPLFEVYTLLLLFFRPMRSYLRTELFLKAVTAVLEKFTIITATYMTINVVINVIIFLVLKRNIVTNFKEIGKNLVLLEGCFLC